MNELVTVYNHQLVTDSRQVAEHFGKQHKDVLKAIDHLVAQNCATKDMFLEQTREYRGQNFRYYLMNRDGFSLLVMGFTGKAALEW
ncbi:Rha family transcriptional regulator [uncultured Megasphaera sp.]|uniref:Rha family transcriptional regulator n=1 Tax=uncultured Megasphaera sp. TaxID=165188 RepID=UPI0025EA298C|nr:Rha family transcriptional regulator [uncultured Megasphaera sp.]